MITFSAFTSDVERNPQILEGMKLAARRQSIDNRSKVYVSNDGKVTTVSAED